MEKYDLIIIAGQSNSIGYGIGPAPEDYEPDERILSISAEPQDYTDENGKFAIRFLNGDHPGFQVADELRGGTARFGDISLLIRRICFPTIKSSTTATTVTSAERVCRYSANAILTRIAGLRRMPEAVTTEQRSSPYGLLRC